MTCSAIRSIPNGVYIPIVMITGLDDAKTITEAFKVEATDFISKPLNSLVFGFRVDYWLRSEAVLQAFQITQKRLLKAQKIALLGYWEKNLENGDFQIISHETEIFGISIPYTFESLFTPIVAEEREHIRKCIINACRDETGVSLQYRITLPCGSERTLVNQGEVVRKGTAQCRHLVGILQDITEQEKAATLLRKSEKKWRAVLERSPLGIVLSTSPGNSSHLHENRQLHQRCSTLTRLLRV